MQTTNPHNFRVIVKENNRTVRSFTVMPSGSEMVAVSPKTLRLEQGPIESVGWQGYDLLIGGIRYRIKGQLPDNNFEVVAWTEDMGE